MRTKQQMKTLGIGLCGVLALLSGTPAVAQDAVKTEVELSIKEIDAKENMIGNLVADAMRSSAKADAAIIEAEAFTSVTTIPKGNVNITNILQAVKYPSDTIVLVKLSGAQILRALEHGLYLYPTPNYGFLQFSGLTITVNPDGEKGKHVVSVKMGGDALDPNKTYRVAMRAPLANGALGYFKIWKKSDIEKDTQKTLEDAVKTYLRERKTITKGETRLVTKGK